MAHRDIDLWPAPPEQQLQKFEHITSYARSERMPWRKGQRRLTEELRATEAYPPAARDCAFPLRAVSYIPRRQFHEALRRRFETELADASTRALHDASPDSSAFRLLSDKQKAIGAGLVLGFAAFFAAAPMAALISLNALVTAYFMAAIFFRLYLTLTGFNLAHESARSAPALADDALPVITILLPVYDEAEGLPLLRRAIETLDYPPQKLDVKLLLEADDLLTIAEAKQLGLDRLCDFVVIPPSEPRTKPKACNHALYLARGELTVVYDAEDQPEPDQLRKAAAAFAANDDRLACVQAFLNYYNADENWLTRLFAVEYALWFDSLLPALEHLRIPIPLGGTSNFFRTRTLVEIGGWDPYNVTEDADLGLRLARSGYRTEILNSTTLEEANCEVRNWVRQRSRWMKGYMQTWLVHMRAPRSSGNFDNWRSVLATQLFVAGNFFSALINPFLWVVFALWLATRADIISAVFPGPLLALNLFALLAGNCFFVYLGVIAPLKRGWPELSPYAVLAPVYWWLTSFAAYRALWQLFTRPSFWEKTDHVLSATARAQRKDALRRDADAA